MTGVEKLSHKDGNELGVARNDICWANECRSTDGLCILDCHVSSFNQISLIKGSKTAFVLVQAIKDLKQCSRVLEITTEVFNLLLHSLFFEVKVNPSNKNGFGGQFEQILEGFSLVSESHDLGAVLQTDLLGEA